MKKRTLILTVPVVAFLVLFATEYPYLWKGATSTYLQGYSSAHLYDASDFDVREMPAILPKELPYHADQLTLDPSIEPQLEALETKGMVVTLRDSILFERYWDDHGAGVQGNSFSMAKSVTAILMQIAVQDGYIDSWDDPLSKYLPEYAPAQEYPVTLRHLITMTAGLKWNENYNNPTGITARAYYGSNVAETMMERVDLGKFEPGSEWEYQSGATQLAGMALRRAIDEPLSDFANRELFTKVGFEQPASWHLDQEGGLELNYCCINAAVRDYTKLGHLMLNHGVVDGHQILDSAWVHHATQPGLVKHYGMSFWLYDNGAYAFRGLNGQLIQVYPSHGVVIMRQGQKSGAAEGHFWESDRLLQEQFSRWFQE